MTLTSQINASASVIAEAKSAAVCPMLTMWPLPLSGARAVAASHIGRENSNRGSSTGFCRWMRIAGPCHAEPPRARGAETHLASVPGRQRDQPDGEPLMDRSDHVEYRLI